jgi:hypothetical protein
MSVRSSGHGAHEAVRRFTGALSRAGAPHAQARRARLHSGGERSRSTSYSAISAVGAPDPAPGGAMPSGCRVLERRPTECVNGRSRLRHPLHLRRAGPALARRGPTARASPSGGEAARSDVRRSGVPRGTLRASGARGGPLSPQRAGVPAHVAEPGAAAASVQPETNALELNTIHPAIEGSRQLSVIHLLPVLSRRPAQPPSRGRASLPAQS